MPSDLWKIICANNVRPEGFFQENFAFALAVAWKYYPWEPTEFEGLSASAGQAVDVNEVLHLIYLSLALFWEKFKKNKRLWEGKGLLMVDFNLVRIVVWYIIFWWEVSY